MAKLRKDRQEFVEERLEQLNKMQARLYGTMENVMVDKRLNGGLVLSLLEKLKAGLNLHKSSSSNMTSSDKLEFSRQFFKDIKNCREAVMNDPGYKAVLGDIDLQLRAIKAEMDQIDEAMKQAPDETKREPLEDRMRELRKIQK